MSTGRRVNEEGETGGQRHSTGGQAEAVPAGARRIKSSDGQAHGSCQATFYGAGGPAGVAGEEVQSQQAPLHGERGAALEAPQRDPVQPQEVLHFPHHPLPDTSELWLLPQPQHVSLRWPSWEPETDWRSLCRTDRSHNCAPPTLEGGSHGFPNQLLLRETGLRRKASDPVQRCHGNGSTRTLLYKALTERENLGHCLFHLWVKGKTLRAC